MHPRIVQALVSQPVRRLRHGLAWRPGRRATYYHRVDDPDCVLLLQAVPTLCAQTGLTVVVRVVGQPAEDVMPDPVRAAEWARLDAVERARWLDVDFEPTWTAPSGDRLRQAQAEALAAGNDLEALLRITRHAWESTEPCGSPANETLLAQLARNTRHLRKAGHYNSATVYFQGEWYWGLDRLGHLENRLGCAPIVAPRNPPENPSKPRCSIAGPSGGAVPRLSAVVGEPTTEQSALRGSLPAMESAPTGPIDFFFSFRSPYSYLALARTRALAEQSGVDLRIRPVLPMVMRGLPVPFVKRLYIVRDCAREARRLGLPFGRVADPVGVGVERCFAVFMYAQQQGRGFDWLQAAARCIWAEGIDVATDRGLKHAVLRAGLDWAEARNALQNEGWRDLAAENRQALLDAGLWGVPSYVWDDRRLWGQDRVEHLARVIGIPVRNKA